MTETDMQLDAVIIGGGVAGLWTLNHLLGLGYRALLFEASELGSGQSVHAQGIIHGGLKYALDGTHGEDARALAAMPALWRDCLAGRGPVDISTTAIASDCTFLWSAGTPGARLVTLLGSRAMASHVQALAPDALPSPLDHPDYRGSVYRVDEPVLDVPSLLANLAANYAGAVHTVNWQEADLQVRDGLARLRLPGAELQPRLLLLAAGAGNQSLLGRLGASEPGMVRRPLQQVILRQPGLPRFFGHCLGRGSEPGLTITSHQDGADVLWYLGGSVATGGAGDEPAAVIDRARRALAASLPGWNETGADWQTLAVDRIEAAGDRRPGRAFLGPVPGIANAQVAWPTKLALAPVLADAVARLLPAPVADTDTNPGFTTGTPRAPAVARPGWRHDAP